MKKAMSAKQIKHLNVMAKEQSFKMTAIDAIYEAIHIAGLTIIIDDSDTLLCKNDKGELVNVWLEGLDNEINDGGLGFDDQIEMYKDD